MITQPYSAFDINTGSDSDSEDLLTFRRNEMSPSDINEDEVGGIDIYFKPDGNKEARCCLYEIFRVFSFCGEEKREKVNEIRVCCGLDDTNDIRDLAAWLLKQADAIDNEKGISENK